MQQERADQEHLVADAIGEQAEADNRERHARQTAAGDFAQIGFGEAEDSAPFGQHVATNGKAHPRRDQGQKAGPENLAVRLHGRCLQYLMFPLRSGRAVITMPARRRVASPEDAAARYVSRWRSPPPVHRTNLDAIRRAAKRGRALQGEAGTGHKLGTLEYNGHRREVNEIGKLPVGRAKRWRRPLPHRHIFTDCRTCVVPRRPASERSATCCQRALLAPLAD